MSLEMQKWYDFVLQQMASEAYLEGVNLSNAHDVTAALQQGNNRGDPYPQRGLTRFADLQAADFLEKFQVIVQASDNPTAPRTSPVYYEGTNILANTGLSVTLIQTKGTNEFSLSIRSTEYQTWSNGGDRERDGLGADVAGIFGQGFALAQIDTL